MTAVAQAVAVAAVLVLLAATLQVEAPPLAVLVVLVFLRQLLGRQPLVVAVVATVLLSRRPDKTGGPR